MQKLELKETLTSPYVLLNADGGEIRIEGRSIPENVIDFYHPILSWIDQYAQNPKDETKVFFKLEYFNTSSSKRLFDIMKKVEALTTQQEKKVSIYWYYEEDDEDIYFAGNDYKALISKVDFNLVEL
ncbi:MAG: DUF1987 domain-containing protein [Bacteroidales bacterium]|jgi:hypothetical protein|nr:DUF1987 domain-containing protein [Bacteroidales bacterium]MDY0253547.1 DUF1987 domain-containing protein [Tenuifilaceae bacterium]